MPSSPSADSALRPPRSAGWGLVLCSLALGFAGCAGIPEEDARKVVQEAFAAANPPGRTGVELLGKSVWLKAPYFESRCIEEKNLAFNDDPNHRPANAKGIPRISPTYQNQRYLTAATDGGWCALLGENPSMTIDHADWVNQRWRIGVSFSVENPTPWFECLSDEWRSRTVEVGVKDGKPELLSDLALSPGDCPHPLPAGEERGGGIRPSTPAPRAPTRLEVISAMRAFDDALGRRDFAGAMEKVSCFNFFEAKKYGSCTTSEFLFLSPLGKGNTPKEGPPWLEYLIDSPDQIGAITRDAGDPTVYNIRLEARKKGGKPRSMAVQWVDGEWKLLAVVSRQAETITTARFIYDLDRREKREIFEKRMKGERIDDQGNPVEEWVEMDPDQYGLNK